MLVFIIFIVILSVLVLVHELGHFWAARKVGVRVDEFGFGLPPKILARKIGETLYSLNLLPFGGFVRLAGEDDAQISREDAVKDSRNFISKTPGQRAFIVVSGVVMNFLLATVLYYLFFFASGFKSLTLPVFFDYRFRFGNVERIATSVLGFGEDSPAEVAGILVGEAVIEIDNMPVYNIGDIKRELLGKEDQEVRVLLMDMRSFERDLRVVRLTPMVSAQGEVLMGTYIGDSVVLWYDSPWKKVFSGPMHAYNMLAYSKFTFSNLVRSAYAERSIAPVSSSVAGPVGIFSVVGNILEGDAEEQPVLRLMDLVALLSLSLALINILPFPALDGGKLVFISLEKILGKPVSHKAEAAVHRVGMLILLVLIVLITVRDVSRFF